MILGCVLAGGKSSRFGSDKALAQLDGLALLDRAVASMAKFCDSVIVVGRDKAPASAMDIICIPDWPRADMGPLGGIAAALIWANEHNYASVLTCSVDCVTLPDDLLEILNPAPAYLETQPVIGHWDVNAAPAIQAILQSEGRHSVKAFAKAANARSVKSVANLANINTRADLAAMEHNDGI